MKVTSHTLVTTYIYDNYYIFLKFCQIIIFRKKMKSNYVSQQKKNCNNFHAFTSRKSIGLN